MYDPMNTWDIKGIGKGTKVERSTRIHQCFCSDIVNISIYIDNDYLKFR